MHTPDVFGLSLPGLIFAVVVFMASFGPSLLPRGWIGQGAISGLAAFVGYLVGLVADGVAAWVMGLVGVRVDVTRTPSPADGVFVIVGLGLVVWLWWWSNRQHDRTAALVGMPDHPFWHDILATLTGIGVTGGLVGLIVGLAWLNRQLRDGFALILPSAGALLAGLIATVVVVAVVNTALFRQALEWLSRSADKTNARALRGLVPPTTEARSGSPGATQSWAELGRRGQIFAASGPTVEQIAALNSGSAVEPVRAYAGWAGSIEATVEVVMAEVARTHALDRRHVVVAISAGRGWVNEFTVQSVEHLTGGDCATIALQYSHLTSSLALVADHDSPREAARALFTAVERAIAARPADRRPLLYVTGESLGSYGGHGIFSDADDILDRTSGALWIGTPGFTDIWLTLTRSRQRGSPEITPVLNNGRHIRFASRPAELTEDAYGRPLGEWLHPRMAYLQHASDPMVWWTPTLGFREPDWLREKAGRDVNPSLRWWFGVTWMQVLIDQLASLKTPPGHGHIYEDALVAIWAGVLDRPDAPVEEITRAIREATNRLGQGEAPALG